MSIPNVQTIFVRRFEIIERSYSYPDGGSKLLYDVFIDAGLVRQESSYDAALKYLTDYLYKLRNKPYPLFQ